MKYIIKNIKYKNYYKSQIPNSGFHFVIDYEETYIFKNKIEANKIINLFKNKSNFEIIRYKKNEL